MNDYKWTLIEEKSLDGAEEEYAKSRSATPVCEADLYKSKDVCPLGRMVFVDNIQRFLISTQKKSDMLLGFKRTCKRPNRCGWRKALSIENYIYCK